MKPIRKLYEAMLSTNVILNTKYLLAYRIVINSIEFQKKKKK